MDDQPVIVLDTHTLIWWVDTAAKLSKKARQATKVAARREGGLVASAISVFEIVTLERRGRLEFKIPASEWLTHIRILPELMIHPITDEIAERAGSLGDVFPGDPADRLIAATALVLGVPLVTHDTKLRAMPSLSTVW